MFMNGSDQLNGGCGRHSGGETLYDILNVCALDPAIYYTYFRTILVPQNFSATLSFQGIILVLLLYH